MREERGRKRREGKGRKRRERRGRRKCRQREGQGGSGEHVR